MIKQLEEELNSLFLELKKDVALLKKDKPEILSDIFRQIHTIKGGVATLGFKKLSKFIHKIENLIDFIRQNTDEDEIMELSKKSILKVLELCESLSTLDKESLDQDTLSIEKEIDFISKIKKIGEEDLNINLENKMEFSEKDSVIYRIEILFEEDVEMKFVKCFLIEKNLLEAGNVISSNIDEIKVDDSQRNYNLSFQTLKSVSKDFIAELCELSGGLDYVYVYLLDDLIKHSINKYIDTTEFTILYLGENKENINLIKNLSFKLKKLNKTEDVFNVDDSKNFLIMEVEKDFDLWSFLSELRLKKSFLNFSIILKEEDAYKKLCAQYFNAEMLYLNTLNENKIKEDIFNGILKTKRLIKR